MTRIHTAIDTLCSFIFCCGLFFVIFMCLVACTPAEEIIAEEIIEESVILMKKNNK